MLNWWGGGGGGGGGLFLEKLIHQKPSESDIQTGDLEIGIKICRVLPDSIRRVDSSGNCTNYTSPVSPVQLLIV